MSTDGILEYQGTKRVLFRGDTSNIVFDTRTTSLGIGVTGSNNPSSNLYITGNAYVSSNLAIGGVMTMGVVNVAARHNLQAVTDMGNVTTHTVEFTNPTTSLVTSGNVEVAKELTVSGNVAVNGINIYGEPKGSNEFDTPGLVIGETWSKDLGFQTKNGNAEYCYIGCFKFNSAVELEITDHGSALHSSSKYTVTRHFGTQPLVSGHCGTQFVQHRLYWSPGNDVNNDYHLWLLPYFGYNSPGDYRIRYRTGVVLDQAENTNNRSECNYGLITGHYGNNNPRSGVGFAPGDAAFPLDIKCIAESDPDCIARLASSITGTPGFRFHTGNGGTSNNWKDTGIDPRGTYAGGALLFVFTMNNSGGDATGAVLYFIRKSYDSTWVSDSSSVIKLAGGTGTTGAASSVSFQSNNNKLEYRTDKHGNGTFYAIEFDK